MSNPFYNVSGAPVTGSPGASAVVRSEFALIAAAFSLLPLLTANTAIVVNGSGTALTNTIGTLALAGNFATTGAFATTLIAGADVSLTLPVVSGTLATLAGVETLSNKTFIAPALGTPASGVLTNCTGTAAGLTAGSVTTNANLTGVITSVGNATSIASQTGTGTKFVVDTSPTLVTPTIGVATATSINKVAITSPATSATLTIADGKTLTVNKTLTLAGTDATTMTFPGTSATIARTDAANTFTGIQTFSTPIAASSVATMTATVGGGVPTPPNDTAKYLRGDGTFAAPGTVNAGTSGQLAYYASSATAVSGNANATISGGTVTLGVSGSVVGQLSLVNATTGSITLAPPTGALGSAVLTLPDATDTIMGRATTDTQTNKTFDTAGTGNVFKINGTGISAVTGTGSAVLAVSPALNGSPTAPTQIIGDNSTNIATTAYVDRVGGFTTGDVKATLKTTADTGWVLMNDGTIGDASSGGTTRANADTSALFTLLWNNTTNTNCPVSSGRGANAAADFAAHKTITLPKMLGRALASAGAGSGLTSRALAATAGSEDIKAHTHGVTDPGHPHTIDLNVSGTGGVAVQIAGGAGAGQSVATESATTGISIQSDGTGSDNLQPTGFLNFMVKL